MVADYSFNSLNVHPEEYNHIKSWLGNKRYQRIYNSTADCSGSGYFSDIFRKVAGVPNTLFIITAGGFKFGAYLAPAWPTNISGTWAEDLTLQSFIFSLKPFSGLPQQFKVTNKQFAGYAWLGVVSFGNDLVIGDDLVVSNYYDATYYYAPFGTSLFVGTITAPGNTIQASLVEVYQVLNL